MKGLFFLQGNPMYGHLSGLGQHGAESAPAPYASGMPVADTNLPANLYAQYARQAIDASSAAGRNALALMQKAAYTYQKQMDGSLTADYAAVQAAIQAVSNSLSAAANAFAWAQGAVVVLATPLGMEYSTGPAGLKWIIGQMESIQQSITLRRKWQTQLAGEWKLMEKNYEASRQKAADAATAAKRAEQAKGSAVDTTKGITGEVIPLFDPTKRPARPGGSSLAPSYGTPAAVEPTLPAGAALAPTTRSLKPLLIGGAAVLGIGALVFLAAR